MVEDAGLSGAIAGNSTPLEQEFSRAVAIMAQLRAPGGCPWDREQSFDSIRRYTLEETYEVLDAIERRDWPGLKDEMGDLLLQVLFYAEMAREAGYFQLQEVVANLNAKLVRRHPHVFGEGAKAGNSDEVLANWEKIKKQERSEQGARENDSMLDAVSRGMPALMEASKLGSKAGSIGFDWQSASPVFEKLDEELEEMRRAIADSEPNGSTAAQEEELGDVLFTVVNLARKLGLQAELALRASNAKFRRRFRQMESLAENRPLAELSSGELEELWLRAKTREREALGR
ncbi:MAG: nucleoside triphosphate pyrophosphohydrolase [Acidobacteriaceae bacterium]